MKTSEAIDQLATALCKAQGEIKGAKKDSTNPHFRSQYADLASVWDAIREPLARNGLSVVQATSGIDGFQGVLITTRLCHSSGQWVEDSLPIPVPKYDPQGVGSAITYGRRYCLAAMVGVAPADDDGQAAMGDKEVAPPQEPSITEAQAADLRALAEEVGADWGKMLAYFGVENIINLPASRYPKAVNLLEKKRRAA